MKYFLKIFYFQIISAYGRNGDLAMAFSVLDERASVKSLHVSTETINFLLQACVSDKQSGFRHGLMVSRKGTFITILIIQNPTFETILLENGLI